MCSTQLGNVIQQGLGFFFIFFAFNSQAFIEETVVDSFAEAHPDRISKHDGYTGLAIIYGTLCISNFFAAPIVEFLNPKWAMISAGLTYIAFEAGFLLLNKPFLYLSSAFVGLGAAVIWTAQGKSLSLNSTNETAGRNSAVFFGICQASLLAGGIFLFIIFHNTAQPTNAISDTITTILYSCFTALTLIGVIVLCFLKIPSASSTELNTSTQNLVDQEPPEVEEHLNHLQVLGSTFALLKTKRLLFMIPTFMYTGIELSFWSSIYPTCVSNTLALGTNTKSLLALTAIAQGTGQTIAGLLFGISKNPKRTRQIVFLGAVVQILAYVLIFVNFPADSPLNSTRGSGLIPPNIWLALASGLLLGFGDFCWNNQIFAHLITKYPTNRCAQAFSLFLFFQSFMCCTVFYYSKMLELQWHLLILVPTAIIGAVCFYVADNITEHQQEEDSTH